MRKNKIKILIAGDRSRFRDGLCRELTLEKDFKVVAQAQNAYQVLNTMRKHKPDILLLDLSIPHSDGKTILWTLNRTRSKTRVIVVTGSEGKNELVLAIEFHTRLGVSKMAGELLVEGVRKVHAGLPHLDDDGLAGGECVLAGGGRPRLPHRPSLSAFAEPPADPYGNWVTEIPSGPKNSDSTRNQAYEPSAAVENLATVEIKRTG